MPARDRVARAMSRVRRWRANQDETSSSSDMSSTAVNTALEEYPSSAEKMRSRRSYVEMATVVVRLWQLGSSLFIYVSIAGLGAYIRRSHLETTRMRGIRHLGLVSLTYAFLVACCLWIFKRLKGRGWVVFAMGTIPADLLMMGLAIAKITILSISGVPANCQGLTREYSVMVQNNEMVRQPRQGYMSLGFGPGTVDNYGELDYLCHLPKAVYGLCVVSIFSFTLSILLTVLQLQRWREPVGMENFYPGHVEEVVPDMIQRGRSRTEEVRLAPLPREVPETPRVAVQTRPAAMVSPYRPSPSMVSGSTIASPPIASTPVAGPSNPPPVPPRPSIAANEEPKYANMPADMVMNVRPRLSMETTSSIDPEIYLISDGFRPQDEPPAYTSRPSSLHGDITLSMSPR